MSGARLPLRLRLAVWTRSVVLPDLSRVVPLETLLRWYTPVATCPQWQGRGETEILAHVDRHLAGCRRMRGRRCLRRGLLAFYFLRLAGRPAVLHFGVFARPQGRTLAHCWTSVGALVDDPPTATCTEVLTWAGPVAAGAAATEANVAA